jgi:hypothetical protein
MRRILKKKLHTLVVAASLVALTTGFASTRIEAKSPGQSEHDRIVKFWTNARVARAVPRDFIRNPKSRSFKPIQWKSMPSTVPTAMNWTNGGEVSTSTGKVFFVMGTTYYLCSASVISENTNGRSIVLTAGHCAYDEVNKKFATNWIFIPEYYASPVPLNPTGSFCSSTSKGCWTAASLVVSNSYANAGAFNDQAVLHDYAFAVMGGGGKSGDADLQAVASSHPIVTALQGSDDDTWIFGYPASGKYKGKTLMYCNGMLGFDTRMDFGTYRIPCSLTAGSSGGPWFHPFTIDGTGSQFSVNSYTYGGSKAMHGPIFGAETQEMFNLAKSTTGNVLYDETP